MLRTPRQDLERELQDPEYAKLYGAAQAKADFAVTLAQARDRSGVSQKALADRLGCSQPYIAKLEGGEANPTLGRAGVILAVLGFQLATHPEPLLPEPVAPPSAFSMDSAAGYPMSDSAPVSGAAAPLMGEPSSRPSGSKLLPLTAVAA